jgi:hypothetical protein
VLEQLVYVATHLSFWQAIVFAGVVATILVVLVGRRRL